MDLFLSSVSRFLLPSSDCDSSEVFTESTSPPKSYCNQKSISEEERYGLFKFVVSVIMREFELGLKPRSISMENWILRTKQVVCLREKKKKKVFKKYHSFLPY